MRETLGSIKAAAWRKRERARELASQPDARRVLKREQFLRVAARFTDLVEAKDGHGNRYLIHPTDPFIGRDLFVNGAFDEHNVNGALDTLRSLGREPTALIDVGANIGPTTIAILSRLPDARGLAVEPAPDNFRLLTQNIAGNGMAGRTVLVNAGASAEPTDLTLSLSPDNPGDHQVGQVAGRETTVVPGIPLDELVAAHKFPDGPLTLLWMDVQGFEGEVIRGASALLASGCAVALEFWPETLRRNGGLDAVLDLVRSPGYAVYELADEGPRLTEPGAQVLLDRAQERGGFIDLLLVGQS